MRHIGDKKHFCGTAKERYQECWAPLSEQMFGALNVYLEWRESLLKFIRDISAIRSIFAANPLEKIVFAPIVFET